MSHIRSRNQNEVSLIQGPPIELQFPPRTLYCPIAQTPVSACIQTFYLELEYVCGFSSRSFAIVIRMFIFIKGPDLIFVNVNYFKRI